MQTHVSSGKNEPQALKNNPDFVYYTINELTPSILTSMFLEREHWLPNINVDEKKISVFHSNDTSLLNQ